MRFSQIETSVKTKRRRRSLSKVKHRFNDEIKRLTFAGDDTSPT